MNDDDNNNQQDDGDADADADDDADSCVGNRIQDMIQKWIYTTIRI